MKHVTYGADQRPRIHLWPDEAGWRASNGPNGLRGPAKASPGAALDACWPESPARGIVIIVEPADQRVEGLAA